MPINLDHIDRRIVAALQTNAARPQREIAEAVGLSQNAYWRRLKALEAEGVITGYRAQVDSAKLGVSMLVFLMVRTRKHSAHWLREFRAQIESIPEICGFFRISGEYDYLLKVAVPDMASYDAVYQQIIAKTELETVTSYFSMEVMFDERPLAL